MKHYWLIILVGIGLLSITGCYTQIAVQNDDNEDFNEPVQPIIIVVTTPPPVIINPVIGGPHPHPKPRPPKYKERNPEPDRLINEQNRDPIRNTGGKDNSEGRGRR